MAGVKRRTKYRKQVQADALDAFQRPDEGQAIVQIVQSHGSNILEVRSRQCCVRYLVPLLTQRHPSLPSRCATAVGNMLSAFSLPSIGS